MAQNVSWAIQKAFLHANRKATAPAAGTSKHSALLAIADSIQKLWADEEGIEWNSLYSNETIGSVSATNTFELPDEIDYLSKDSDDPILLTNGTQTEYITLVRPGQLYKKRDSNRYAAQIGRNLVFSKAFVATDSTFGYDIVVPAIMLVEDITSENDEIQVDRPMWLAYMMAAEFARNDTVKQGQYDNLLALADVVMTKMKSENGGQDEFVTAGRWQAAGEDW